MSRRAVNVLYVFAMVAVVIGVDLLFFRHHIWLRLVVNVGIVLVFVLSYFRFVKRQ
jgi:predicted cobalt transporter CbtA